VQAASASDLGFPRRRAVDVVFSSNFLEHCHEGGGSNVDARGATVLRKGGRLILLGPNVRPIRVLLGLLRPSRTLSDGVCARR